MAPAAYFVVALLLPGSRALGADSRDHAFSMELPNGWRLIDPIRIQKDVLFAARPSSWREADGALAVSRLPLPPGLTLKAFAGAKVSEFRRREAGGPGPSPARAMELRKGLGAAYRFTAGDPMHRYAFVYFRFDGSDYSAVCPSQREAEMRAILATIGPPASRRRLRPRLGPFSIEIPPGWTLVQDGATNIELGRPQNQSFFLRAADLPPAVASAPTLEGDLDRSLTNLIVGARLSRLRRVSFARGRGLAVWVWADRGSQGTVLSGVLWVGGRAWRLAILSSDSAEALARAILSSWSAAPQRRRR